MKDAFTGILRHLLTAGGGFLTSKELASGEDITAAVTAAITLFGFAWSIWDKIQRSKAAKQEAE